MDNNGNQNLEGPFFKISIAQTVSKWQPPMLGQLKRLKHLGALLAGFWMTYSATPFGVMPSVKESLASKQTNKQTNKQTFTHIYIYIYAICVYYCKFKKIYRHFD